MRARIGILQCACGYPTCGTYWLVGIGHFVQGAGFTKQEAARIVAALNDYGVRDELVEALRMVCDADDDCVRDGLPRMLPATVRGAMDAVLAKTGAVS